MVVPISRLLSAALLGATSVVIAGCTTAVNGTSQTIKVGSTPGEAQCSFEAAGTMLGTVTTPSQITVPRASHPINVVCRKPGYEATRTTLPSQALSLSVPGPTVILAAGYLIDKASGAENTYPPAVHARLEPLSDADRAFVSATASNAVDGRLAPGLWLCVMRALPPAVDVPRPLRLAIAGDGSVVVRTYDGAVATVSNRSPLSFTAIDPRTSQLMTFAWKDDNTLLVTGGDGVTPEAGPCTKT
ncbi:MAG: hypothetical protein U1E23_00775 [Reyranellaceae bacterium]